MAFVQFRLRLRSDAAVRTVEEVDLHAETLRMTLRNAFGVTVVNSFQFTRSSQA